MQLAVSSICSTYFPLTHFLASPFKPLAPTTWSPNPLNPPPNEVTPGVYLNPAQGPTSLGSYKSTSMCTCKHSMCVSAGGGVYLGRALGVGVPPLQGRRAREHQTGQWGERVPSCGMLVVGRGKGQGRKGQSTNPIPNKDRHQDLQVIIFLEFHIKKEMDGSN